MEFCDFPAMLFRKSEWDCDRSGSVTVRLSVGDHISRTLSSLKKRTYAGFRVVFTFDLEETLTVWTPNATVSPGTGYRS
jgi:hypothetical protein